MTPDSISYESMQTASKQLYQESPKQTPKKSLLQWVSKAMPKDLGIEVNDFGTSWRDGLAFLGLINAIDENLVDVDDYRNVSNKVRLTTGFDMAEKDLGIPRLLDAEDVDVNKPDEKSIMTYVAQFLHKYPEPRVSLSRVTKFLRIYKDFLSN